MKSKLILMAGEAVLLNLGALFFLWKLYIRPAMESAAGSQQMIDAAGKGLGIFAAIYLLMTGLICLQGYWYVMRPTEEKIRKLEQAAEESKKAEQIRREFVANVSHELKTPLTSISGFIETLQAGASEEPEIRTKFIDIIAIETARLKRLIEDLLVLSDIENKRDGEQLEFDVKRAVESTVEALKPIAEEKRIQIIQAFDRDINICGSVDRFRQMMVNLIENAIKYSEADSRIWVSVLKVDGKIQVSVKDEGIGIAPEHHERLFERFYRVDKSRSKKAGGTGLGLSIVKHIAVLFDAGLRVESRLGQGTTFFVTFEQEACPTEPRRKGTDSAS